ncbi:MAG: FkbM family methyltransferase [Bacteroidota bacterium]
MKELLRKLFNKAGYDIIKTPLHSDSKAGTSVKVQVGNFPIYLPGNNPHISTYTFRPDANNLLGILAAQVAPKYPDMHLIDIGANVGDTAAVVKTNVDIPVIAIEGDPISFQYLERNTQQFRGMTLIKEFLGEEKQTIHVNLEKTGWNTTLIPTKNTGQEISLKTLDEVLVEYKVMDVTIKVLKIDCEGFDTIILRGSGDLLLKHKPVLFFEYNRVNMDAIKEDGLSTLFALERFGYKSVIFFDNYGRYMLTTPISQHELIRELHYYSEDSISQIGYFDVCLFHENDADIAKKFTQRVAGYK